MKAFEVENLDLSTAVIDDAFALKRVCNRADTCSLNTEEMSQEFLSEFYLTMTRTLAHHGEPAAHSRLDGVEMVADRGLSELSDLHIAVSQDGVVENTALGEQLKNAAGVDDIAFAWSLDQSLVRHRVLAEHERRSDHALETGKPDLDRSAILRFSEQ